MRHMQDAGLTSTLAGTTIKATVFAPTDNAFSNLLAAIGLTAAQLLADPNTLSEVRELHILLDKRLLRSACLTMRAARRT